MATQHFGILVTKLPDGKMKSDIKMDGDIKTLSGALAAFMQHDQRVRDLVMTAIYNLVSQGQAVAIEDVEDLEDKNLNS